jgi:YVTN family beta-propeller protein
MVDSLRNKRRGATWSPRGSGGQGALPCCVAPTHARITMDVTGTAILTVTGEFYAPINVDITPLAIGPSIGVAVNPATKLVYFVTEGLNNDVPVIDANSNTVVRRISLTPQNHFQAAVNPVTNRIYVTGTNSVEVIDGDQHSFIGSFVVGPGLNFIAVNSTTNRIYAANVQNATVAVVDGSTHAILAHVPVGRAPYAVAVNSTTNRIYVGSGLGDPIAVIDGETNTVIATISTEARSSRSLAVNPVTNKLYVGVRGRVLIIDGGTNEVIDAVLLGGDVLGGSVETLAVDSVRNRIYASSGPLVTHGTGYIFIIHGWSHHVIAAIPILSPTGQGALDVLSETRQLYAAGHRMATSLVDDFVGSADLVDVAISASALPDSVVLGTDSQVTFTLSNVTEHGPGTTTNVTVSLIPNGWRIISATSSDATCKPLFSTSVLRCVVAELEKDASVSITLDLQPEGTGPITILGSVSADQVDINGSNNIVFRRTTVMTE